MKRVFLAVVVLILSPTAGLAAADAEPAVDIFKADWLAGFFPRALLVVQPDEPGAVQESFARALAEVQRVHPVKLTPFPVGQRPLRKKHFESLEQLSLKSGDAGFLVLVSQTGKVAAIYVAYATDRTWARATAALVARCTFEPARLDGRPVPVLLCWRWALDHHIDIN